jgi:uncharacterized RDD family membrane protein YckC
MAKLIINPTSASRREVHLPRATFSIGRDPGNDLVLPDAMVSRRHAVIEMRGEQFFLKDCNSSNGSLLNGDRVSESSLKDGDLVAIGTSRLLFREEGDGAQTGGAAAKVLPHPHAAHLVCPACGAEHRAGDQFCRQCGAQIAPKVAANAVCPTCGTVVSLPAKFCHVCGAQIPSVGDQLEVTKPQPQLRDEEPSVAPPAPPPPPRPAPPVVRPAPAAAAPRPAPPPAPIPARAPRPAAVPVRGAPVVSRTPHRLEPANPLLRLIAAGIDSAVVTIGELFLLLPIGYYWWSRDLPQTAAEVSFLPILLSLMLVGLAILLAALYYVYFWGVQGATPGKHVLGLTVVDSDGRAPIGVAAAILRLLGYAVSGLLLGIGFLLVPLTGRGLHDRIAGTLVVQRDRV